MLYIIIIIIIIVSRYLATRCNNKILRTSPPYISISGRYFPCSLVAPLPKSEQINHSFSSNTYTKLTPNSIYHHYAPFVTLTHTTHIISSTSPIYAPRCHPGIVDRPRRGNGPAGQMDGEAGWWTTSGKIGLPPLERVREWVDNNN